MSRVLLCALAVLVVAGDDTTQSAAASPTQYTPQEKLLALNTYGNFACKVNTLKVTTENPGVNPVVSPKDIRAAFETVDNLEWAHVMQAPFSTTDGRNDEKVLGTPGGDMGEFIQALAVFSKLAGKSFSQADVTKMFERYLKVMTRQKFNYQTDEKAYMKLAVATGCKNLHVADMGGMKRKREAYLEKIAIPEHIGDPFIRFLVEKNETTGVNTEIVHHALAAYHTVLWTTPSKLASKLCYLEVKGAPHTEAALIHIRTDPYCVDQGLAPLISAQLACPAPVIVNHPDAVKLLRRELVSVLTDTPNMGANVDARDVIAELNLLAEGNLNLYWNEYGVDLPVYTVEFGNTSPLLSGDVSFQE